MKDSEVVLAVLGGGDWYDASVEHYVVSRSVDMDKEMDKYKRWRRNVQDPLFEKWKEGGRKPPYPDFLHFTDWLLQNGTIRDPNDDELVVFYD
jgi:hypothetical protein